jgi:phosphoglycolate phosphatase-like HAD superfamily hydrolase
MGFDWPEPSRALLLFDIDGTLLRGRGVGRRLMETAFGRALSRDASDIDLRAIPFHGNTDPSIVKAGLEAVGEPPTTARVEAVIGHYL